jgi:hypothetical protein
MHNAVSIDQIIFMKMSIYYSSDGAYERMLLLKIPALYFELRTISESTDAPEAQYAGFTKLLRKRLQNFFPSQFRQWSRRVSRLARLSGRRRI